MIHNSNVVIRMRMLKLTARDSAFLAERLLNPPEPREALRAAAARYRAMTGQLLSPLLWTL
jgi:uncharacterized protein (DUF1778 family)